MKFDIVTFGSGVVDAFIDTDISEKKGFMCYEVGSKILINDLKYDIGGGGTNCAVAFSRFGLKTGWIGKVGRDNNGKEILQLIKKEKIKFLGKDDKIGKSGYSVVLDSKDKNRTILTYKGVNDRVGLKDIKLRKVKTKWLYYTSLLGKSFETQIKLARLMVGRGVNLVFNPSSYLIKRRDLTELLKLSKVLILNKEEAEMLLEKQGVKEKDLLVGLSKLGPQVVVITDKNNLIRAYDSREGRKCSLRPHKVKIVERTGAGDAFGAGFVAGLVVGLSIDECLKLGLKESESVIRYFGAKNKLLKINLKKIK